MIQFKVGDEVTIYDGSVIFEIVKVDTSCDFIWCVAKANPNGPQISTHISNAKMYQPSVDTAKAKDPVSHPAHYTQGAVECVDAIKAALTPEEFRGYCKGNALKYIWREKHKGGHESLAKAEWYLDRLTSD